MPQIMGVTLTLVDHWDFQVKIRVYSCNPFVFKVPTYFFFFFDPGLKINYSLFFIELELGTQCVVEMDEKQTILHQDTTLDKVER